MIRLLSVPPLAPPTSYFILFQGASQFRWLPLTPSEARTLDNHCFCSVPSLEPSSFDLLISFPLLCFFFVCVCVVSFAPPPIPHPTPLPAFQPYWNPAHTLCLCRSLSTSSAALFHHFLLLIRWSCLTNQIKLFGNKEFFYTLLCEPVVPRVTGRPELAKRRFWNVTVYGNWNLRWRIGSFLELHHRQTR